MNTALLEMSQAMTTTLDAAKTAVRSAAEREWLTSSDPQRMLDSLPAREHLGGEYDRKLRLFAIACCRQIWDLLTDNRSRHAVEAAERFVEGDILFSELHDAVIAADAAYREQLLLSPNSPDDECQRRLACHWVAPVMGEWSVFDCVEHVLRSLSSSGMGARADLLRDVFGNPYAPSPGDSHVEGLYICEKCDHVFNYYRDLPEGTPLHCPGCGPNVRKYRTRDHWIRSNNSQVKSLAEAIYRDRDFSVAAMNALADALEEAGCLPAKSRTISQVIEERRHAVMGGCCNRFADQTACDCLETAEPDGVLEHLREKNAVHARGCWVVDCCRGVS